MSFMVLDHLVALVATVVSTTADASIDVVSRGTLAGASGGRAAGIGARERAARSAVAVGASLAARGVAGTAELGGKDGVGVTGGDGARGGEGEHGAHGEGEGGGELHFDGWSLVGFDVGL